MTACHRNWKEVPRGHGICFCAALTNSEKEMPGDQELGSAMILALMRSVKTKHIQEGSPSLRIRKRRPFFNEYKKHMYILIAGRKNLPFAQNEIMPPFSLKN